MKENNKYNPQIRVEFWKDVERINLNQLNISPFLSVLSVLN